MGSGVVLNTARRSVTSLLYPSLTLCTFINRVTHIQKWGGVEFLQHWCTPNVNSPLHGCGNLTERGASDRWHPLSEMHTLQLLYQNQICVRMTVKTGEAKGETKKESGMKGETLIKFSQYVHYWTVITFATEHMKALCDASDTHWLTEKFGCHFERSIMAVSSLSGC